MKQLIFIFTSPGEYFSEHEIISCLLPDYCNLFSIMCSSPQIKLIYSCILLVTSSRYVQSAKFSNKQLSKCCLA